jgi:PAS domain S-box-containing protein
MQRVSDPGPNCRPGVASSAQRERLRTRLPGCPGILRLAAALILLAAPVRSSAQPAPESALTSAARILDLRSSQIRAGRPVALDGVVVAVDEPGRQFFLHDGSAGILVRQTGAGVRVAVKDRVRVSGTTTAGGLAPAVSARAIAVTGRGEVPRAERASITQLASGMLDAQWVEIEGVIRSVENDRTGAVADLSVDGWEFAVRIGGEADALRDIQVDTRLRVRGVCQVRVDDRHRPTGFVSILSPDRTFVDVLAAGTADPFSAPVWLVQDLAEFSAQRAFGRLIRLRASVVLHRPGISIFVRDATGSIYAETNQTAPVALGDVVDVVGFLANEDGPTLERATYRVVAHGPPPEPREVTAAQVTGGDVLDELIRIRARLENAAGDSLSLTAGGLRFFAILDDGGLDALDLTPGSDLALTGVGIVTLRDGAVNGFKLRLRTLEDVAVVRRAWFLSFDRVMWIIGSAGAAAALLVGWSVSLRRKVRAQTDVIRQRLEREAHLEARCSELIEHARDMHVTLDLERRVTSINHAGELMTGHARADLIGRPLDRLLASPGAEVDLAEQSTITIETPDGRHAVLEVRWQEILDEAHVRAGWHGLARDVTARHEAEDALRRAKEAAEASTRAKSEFLANMSHEIRTPMNGILGMTELALGTELTREQREYLDLVQTSARSLLAIIDDVLDLSRIEAGRMETDPVPVDLRELFAHVLRPFEPRARQKGLDLRQRIGPDVPACVVLDPVRFRQVLVNLVGNAVKFTDRGFVDVDLDLASDAAAAAEHVNLHLAVRDSGIGIPADKQQIIFEAFTQADGSVTRRHGGTGLGPSICAKLVDLLGGRLWLESAPGTGSCFHVIVPATVSRARPVQEGAAAPTSSRHRRILVVEDNPVNLLAARRMLERQGHEVQTVDRAQAALELLTGPPFDLIFMDVQMPDMNGFEATAEIRRRELLLGRRTRIVAMTAHAMIGDRERCLAAGMDDYVTKPLDSAALAAAVERAGAASHAPTTRAS